MTRPVVATLVVALSLACGGAIQDAKQAARDRVEQEIAEEVVRQVGGLDELEVEDDRIAIGVDGERMVVESTGTLPADFPIALPSDVTIQTVASFEIDGKTTVSVMGEGTARDPSADIDAALQGSGFTASVRQIVENNATVQAEKGDEQLTIAVSAAEGTSSMWLVAWVR